MQRDREAPLVGLNLEVELQPAFQLVDEIYLVSRSREGKD
jgi:hypothetical protein